MAAGELARKAKAAKEEETAGSLDRMLGLGPEMSIGGKRYTLFPLTIKRKRLLSRALADLGDEYVVTALAQDNPEGLLRLAQAAGTADGGATLTSADVASSLRVLHATLSEAQEAAIVDIAELALNGPGQTVTRDEIEDSLALNAFPSLLRAFMDGSGYSPLA